MSTSALRVALVVAVAGLPLLTGCAGGPALNRDGPAAEAPSYQVGDRWVYKAQDGFRNPVVWEETHEVIAAGSGGITVRVTQRGPSVNTDRTEEWTTPGIVRKGAVFDDETRVFGKPMTRYAFPLKPGDTVREWVDNLDQKTGRTGQFSRWVSVNGWGKVATPAGSFDALRLSVVMRLDDEDSWRHGTECSYVLWYAPAVRSTVREEKEAQYVERSDGLRGIPIRSQHAVMELVSFTPGSG